MTHRFQGRAILDDVSLTVHQGNRLGLLGVNGAGKSTLMRILSGQEPQDEGEVVRARGLRIGYLHQEFVLDPDATVRESIEAGLAEPRALLARYHALSHQLAEDPAVAVEHERLQAEIDRLDAWNLDVEVARVMQHLRVPDPERPIRGLSGGEMRRVSLASTLVAKPDLLVLDEPTNHLDAETIAWLEGYLASYAGTVVLVTHDRYFLDNVADRMIELDFGKLAEYVGNYSEYLLLKAEREEAQAKSEHVRQMTIRRELQWVRKQPKARSTKQQARVDRFQELVDQAPPDSHGEFDLLIPMSQRLGNKVVQLKGVTKRFGDRTLISNLDLELAAGMRLGVIGPNGMGKTTLMRMILGQDQPDIGTIEVGVNTRFVYADQGRHLLDPEKTVVEEVAGDSQWVTIEDRQITVRSYLKRFLFTDEQANTPVKRMSGGEQNRVQLAKLLRKGGNVLILDEPTNDLDLMTLRALEDALVAFKGCALIVSHDRYFLNRVATGILAFEGEGRIVYSEGSYDRYMERRAVPSVTKPVPTPSSAPAAKSERPTQRKMSYKETKELEGIEARIEEAEEKVSTLDAALQDPSLYAERGHEVQGLLDQAETAKREVEALYLRWQELEAIRDGLVPAEA
ncbi:energy-dependent translational throttle protein EttA [bacterium]|nr:energy-dependent translational throttle protein EttA [bacterium]